MAFVKPSFSLKDALVYWLYHLNNRCVDGLSRSGNYPHNFHDKN